MDLLLNTTLVCVAIVVGLVIYALVAGSKRSDKDWSELREVDRDFKRNHSDGAKFEAEDHFLDREIDWKPPMLYPYELNSEGEIEPVTLHNPRPPPE